MENDRVCSEHFVSGKSAADWDKHNIDWVPTLKLGHSKNQSKNSSAAAERAARTAERRKRIQASFQEERRKKIAKLNEPGETVEQIIRSANTGESLCNEDSVTTDSTFSNNNNTAWDISSSFEGISMVDYAGCMANDFDSMSNKNHADATSDVGVETDEFEYLFREGHPSQKPFTEEYFVDDDERVRFYTGLTSFDVLKATFDFIKPFITRRSLNLSVFQEFILVLMKLRLNVPYQDLAYRFNVSLSTVSRTFLAWMIVMDIRLSPLISWPEREDLWRTMPKCFQYSFGKKTTVIIDCFEVFMERPSNLLARAQTFSNYKHHNTVKVLIGITPQGTISFVSNAWGGRTSDKFLTENCGILGKLKPGDLVMADRGFTIHESVWFQQAELAIPAFTRGKDQLDSIDLEKTRGIANVRIHVERVTGLLRHKYKVL